jgi:hypothetical protein
MKIALLTLTVLVTGALALHAAPNSTRIIVDGSAGYLLGASRNGQWIKAEDARHMVRGGETYSVLSGARLTGLTKGGKAESFGVPCEDTQLVKLNSASRGIAVTALQKPWPRPVKQWNSRHAGYRQIVARWLKARGIKNPQVGTMRIWHVDLDGNGTSEVLINAVRQNAKGGSPQHIAASSAAGDYSVVLLRHVSGKTVKTVPVASEIYPAAKTFNAPSVSDMMSILDLNGDGRMEIVLRDRYYEGDSVGVYEWKGGKAHEVLIAGCGV